MGCTDSKVSTVNPFLHSPFQAFIESFFNQSFQRFLVGIRGPRAFIVKSFLVVKRRRVVDHSVLDKLCLCVGEVGHSDVRRVNHSFESFLRCQRTVEVPQVPDQDMNLVPEQWHIPERVNRDIYRRILLHPD